ncbi:MAG: carbohydrate kinase family protein [Patescibacteria group bacterium]
MVSVSNITRNTSEKSYQDIVITGSMSYDIIMDFPSRFQEHLQPDMLHQLNVSFVVDKLDKQFGGTATNIAYTLGILGHPSIKILSSVGKDGEALILFLKDAGVDISAVLTDTEIYSATGQVITDRDNNQIWGFYYGACANAVHIETAQHADQNSIFVISANHPDAFRHFQKQAIEIGLDYLYDPGMTLAWNTGEGLRAGVEHCRWLVGNDYEISWTLRLLNTTAEELNQKGVIVITTLGDHGVRYQDGDEQYEVPSYHPKDVLDPTGAGDAWRSGFLFGVIQKRPVLDCLLLGNAAASFAVEKYGTVNHTPSLHNIEMRANELRNRYDAS